MQHKIVFVFVFLSDSDPKNFSDPISVTHSRSRCPGYSHKSESKSRMTFPRIDSSRRLRSHISSVFEICRKPPNRINYIHVSQLLRGVSHSQISPELNRAWEWLIRELTVYYVAKITRTKKEKFSRRNVVRLVSISANNEIVELTVRIA